MKLSRIHLAAAALLISVAPVLAEEAEHVVEKSSLTHGPSEGLITAVTTLLVFLGLLVILGKFAWGPILKGLKGREDSIRKDIAEAEAARSKSEATLRQYQDQLAKAQDEIRSLLDKAQTDGQALATRIKMQAQQEAEDAKDRATKEIDAAKKAAVTEIHDHAATLSTSIAEKILRRNLSADDQRDLVRGALDQLGSSN